VSIPDDFPRIEGAKKEREAHVKQAALSVPSSDQADAVFGRVAARAGFGTPESTLPEGRHVFD
jgi:hypothetical protein